MVCVSFAQQSLCIYDTAGSGQGTETLSCLVEGLASVSKPAADTLRNILDALI